MAKKVTKKRKAQPKPEVQADQLHFGLLNYIGFALGLLLIIVGFYTLHLGSETLAPILLVVGYCVVMPIAIIIKDKRRVNVGE